MEEGGLVDALCFWFVALAAPSDPPDPKLAAAPGILLALLQRLISKTTTPALSSDVILLWISGSTAPTLHTTLRAPSSSWYRDSAETGLLLQPGFREFVTSAYWPSDVETVVWLGKIGRGPLDLAFATELRSSTVYDSATFKYNTVQTRRKQGVPNVGAGSSLGAWVGDRGNVTSRIPFLGVLWDPKMPSQLGYSNSGLGVKGEMTRFLHLYTRGSVDKLDWFDKPTNGSLQAVGEFLEQYLADPGKVEANAEHGTNYEGWNYYPLGNLMVSYGPGGAWALAVIDFLLAIAYVGWGIWRRYATAPGMSLWRECWGWLWTSVLWILGMCLGAGLPVAVWAGSINQA